MIKKLEKSDFEFIAGVKNVDFPDGWNLKMLEDAFNTGNFYGYVYTSNGLKVAFITYMVGLDGCDVEDVYTCSEYRNKGIAKQLLRKALKDIKSKNVSKIFLEVRENNEVARKFYESFGFSEISVRKKYYFDGTNAIVYLKEI